jgi:pyruvate dehydrogenase E1 component alpha subunit
MINYSPTDVSGYTTQEVADIITKLLTVRMVEEQIVKRYKVNGAEQLMRCPVHLSIGQEAAAVGACFHLQNSDNILSTHRCHAHYLAKGGCINKMIYELYGKLGGCIDGRGGSMHLMDPAVGMMMSVPIVASAIPLAVGCALADTLDDQANVSMAFFGDAAVEEGVFHESMNFAAVKGLPVIFVCENNLYSVYTHINERQPQRPLESLATAHGIEVSRMNGNNVFAVSRKFDDLIETTRQTQQPHLIILDTYRSREHCGVNFDDHLNYRDSQETDDWLKQDPIKIGLELALQSGAMSEVKLAEIKNAIADEIETAFDSAERAPLPTPEMARKYVYA